MGARGDAIGDKHALLKWIGEKLNELCGFTEANKPIRFGHRGKARHVFIFIA